MDVFLKSHGSPGNRTNNLQITFFITQGFRLDFGTVPTCLYATGANLQEVENIFNRGMSSTRSSNCFIKCVGEGSGLIRNGGLNPEDFGSLPMVSWLDRQSFSAVKNCLQDKRGVRINSCEDMENIRECLTLIQTK